MNRNIILISTFTDPAINLAIEAHLTENVQRDRIILFLWQNHNTVVIGRNQNIYKECDIYSANKHNVSIIRRPSGGGAVYHDSGNLNFSFIAGEEVYDVDEQMRVIQNTLLEFGLKAEFTGRNDLTIDDKKFSGNAFYGDRGKCHHGTLLVNTDLRLMGELLTPPIKKLESNSVSSVKSRVVNLNELNSDVTIESLKEAIIKVFKSKYGAKIQYYVDVDRGLEDLISQYRSKFWSYYDCPIYGNNISDRFDWGYICLSYEIQDGCIEECSIDTDSLILQDFKGLAGNLKKISIVDMNVKQIVKNSITDETIAKDIISLIEDNLI